MKNPIKKALDGTRNIISFNFKGVPWMLIFTMLLTTLKCLGKFDQSWWWVTAPLWGPAAIVIGILALILGVAAAAMALVSIFHVLAWVYEQAAYPIRRFFARSKKGGSR